MARSCSWSFPAQKLQRVCVHTYLHVRFTDKQQFFGNRGPTDTSWALLGYRLSLMQLNVPLAMTNWSLWVFQARLSTCNPNILPFVAVHGLGPSKEFPTSPTTNYISERSEKLQQSFLEKLAEKAEPERHDPFANGTLSNTQRSEACCSATESNKIRGTCWEWRLWVPALPASKPIAGISSSVCKLPNAGSTLSQDSRSTSAQYMCSFALTNRRQGYLNTWSPAEASCL
jgi:hypothetical protein